MKPTCKPSAEAGNERTTGPAPGPSVTYRSQNTAPARVAYQQPPHTCTPQQYHNHIERQVTGPRPQEQGMRKPRGDTVPLPQVASNPRTLRNAHTWPPHQLRATLNTSRPWAGHASLTYYHADMARNDGSMQLPQRLTWLRGRRLGDRSCGE